MDKKVQLQKVDKKGEGMRGEIRNLRDRLEKEEFSGEVYDKRLRLI